MNKFIFLTIILFCAANINAQQKVISGKVTSFDYIGLKGVLVKAVKAKTSTETDSTGYFQIPCNEKDVIKFTANQFRSAKKKINPGSADTMNISLNLNLIDFDLETAFKQGYIRQTDVETVNKYIEDNGPNYCQFSNIFEIIQVYCTGVEVNTDSGEPVVRLNGSSESVVYVLDNIPVNYISNIQPCNIKSIKVLKDPTSTAPYISSGKNGVIMIKTKR